MEPAIAASSLIFSRFDQQMSCRGNGKHVGICGFSEMREIKSGERRKKTGKEKKKRILHLMYHLFIDLLQKKYTQHVK